MELLSSIFSLINLVSKFLGHDGAIDMASSFLSI